MAKKLRFDIDPEDKNHEIREVQSGQLLKKVENFDKSKLNIIKEETLTLIFSSNSPGCVTLYFRGIPYQVCS